MMLHKFLTGKILNKYCQLNYDDNCCDYNRGCFSCLGFEYSQFYFCFQLSIITIGQLIMCVTSPHIAAARAVWQRSTVLYCLYSVDENGTLLSDTGTHAKKLLSVRQGTRTRVHLIPVKRLSYTTIHTYIKSCILTFIHKIIKISTFQLIKSYNLNFGI